MIYLALGSNLDDRRDALKRAKGLLKENGITLVAQSAVYETPALMPLSAADSWQLNFLNQVVAVSCNHGPTELLKVVKSIERAMGRTGSERWSPRFIDIDILVFNDLMLDSDDLKIPHTGIGVRSFFASPLFELAEALADTGLMTKLNDAFSKGLVPLPRWMSIVNVTPDSFSSSPESSGFDLEFNLAKIESDLEQGAHIIDIGAESTRPGATPLTHEEEWSRLAPILPKAMKLCRQYEAKLSVDSYRPETIKKVLTEGADLINDVGGLKDEKTLEMFLSSHCDWVVMHSLSLPVNKSIVLDSSLPAHLHILKWIDYIETRVPTKDRSRIIIDPGIGFGKSAEQSRDILTHWKLIQDRGYRVLIGHSRKSFLTGITKLPFAERDLETVSLSMRLASEGLDFLRVHNMEAHRRAQLAYHTF